MKLSIKGIFRKIYFNKLRVKPLFKILEIAIFSLVFVSCAVSLSSRKALVQEQWFDQKNTFTVWAISDTHVKDEVNSQNLENAIEDMNKYVPGIDMVLVSGDVVDQAKKESIDLYLETRALSDVIEWYEIVGSNHDFRPDGGQLFRENIREDVHYTVQKGNILFIFMSDSGTGAERPTGFSDELFNWWKDIVINNQDKIIVVVTHPPLKGSDILFTSTGHHYILNSERFISILARYNVDLWLSGHLHIHQSAPKTIVRQEHLKGTVFIHLSSIIPDLGGFKQSESRTLTFVCGSRNVLVRSRNHKRKSFVPALDKVIELSKPFECGELIQN
ncbi:MAG: metallophosphoesterase family protein [Thermodesulfobacteriota bacterium]